MAQAYCFMAVSSLKTSISRMTFWNMEVRCTIRWLGGGLAVIVGLLVGELVLGELVLVELVASSVAFRSWTWLVGVRQVMQPCWKYGGFIRQVF